MSLCVILSGWYLSVSFRICTHTHAQTHAYTFWNAGLPTHSHTFTYMHTHTCTCARRHAHAHTHTHYLVPTNTAQLIFCFEDCFLNQIKAFQPTNERRPSALESGGRNRSQRTASPRPAGAARSAPSPETESKNRPQGLPVENGNETNTGSFKQEQKSVCRYAQQDECSQLRNRWLPTSAPTEEGKLGWCLQVTVSLQRDTAVRQSPLKLPGL